MRGSIIAATLLTILPEALRQFSDMHAGPPSSLSW